MSLYARTLNPREAKSLGSTRTPDVRRLGVPRGREPLSLEEMWELARVESYGPGDEVVFLRYKCTLFLSLCLCVCAFWCCGVLLMPTLMRCCVDAFPRTFESQGLMVDSCGYSIIQ